MDWKDLLTLDRLHAGLSKSEEHGRTPYAKDIDRITFSSAFRRLANKTQVQPLYDHDHVHHRLIHSVEVGSVGRSLGGAIGLWIQAHKDPGVDPAVISGIVQAASLAHDIGNPPFGHSGENAITEWFRREIKKNRYILFQHAAEQAPAELQDLAFFDGNSQGFRLLTTLETHRDKGGLRLTQAVLAAFVKYPITAAQRDMIPEHDKSYCGLKKAGVFASEWETYAHVAQTLGISQRTTSDGQSYYVRHPLVFAVEAADDICYNIMDLEDAYTSGILPYDELRGKFFNVFKDHELAEIAAYKDEDKIACIRAKLIGRVIDGCIEAFKENYDAIMAGDFSTSLVEASEHGAMFSEIRHICKTRLFEDPKKLELEVFGRNVIHQILNGFIGLYEDLAEQNYDQRKMKRYHAQLAKAAGLDLSGVHNAMSALRSLADFIAGMTDRYAVKTAKMVVGV